MTLTVTGAQADALTFLPPGDMQVRDLDAGWLEVFVGEQTFSVGPNGEVREVVDGTERAA